MVKQRKTPVNPRCLGYLLSPAFTWTRRVVLRDLASFMTCRSKFSKFSMEKNSNRVWSPQRFSTFVFCVVVRGDYIDLVELSLQRHSKSGNIDFSVFQHNFERRKKVVLQINFTTSRKIISHVIKPISCNRRFFVDFFNKSLLHLRQYSQL